MNNLIEMNNEHFIDWESDFSHTYSNLPKKSIKSWEVAYFARELRINNEVTLTCNSSEVEEIISQLTYFSNSNLKIEKSTESISPEKVLVKIKN